MFSITPYNVHVGFAHVGDLVTSLNELRNYKRRIHGKARDVFKKIRLRLEHKWGPNALAASIGVPGEVPIEKAQEFREDKKFWQPFFDLYSESTCVPIGTGVDGDAKYKDECRWYIDSGDNGIKNWGRWPTYAKAQFLSENPEDIGIWDSPDSSLTGGPADVGKPNGTSFRSDLAKELAQFETEFDKWIIEFNKISEGLAKEDASKASPVNTTATKEEIEKRLNDQGLGGLGSDFKSFGATAGAFLDKVVLVAGIGLAIYVAIQVFPMIKTMMSKPTPAPLPPGPSPVPQLPA